jgi:ATP-dependent Clp protease adaptor protein ClpS
MNDTEPRAIPPPLGPSSSFSSWGSGGGSPPSSGGSGSPPQGPGGGVPGQGPGFEEDVDLEERQKTARPRRYKVVFHNDDYTTMEFVVDVLRQFFHKSETEALHIMLTVHKKGSAVAGVYPRDVEETKVSEVTRHSRESGMPLLVTAEPE